MPDSTLDQARSFLDLMAEGEPVTFQTFGDADKSKKLARILHGDLDQHAPELTRLNGAGAGVFWMVNYGDGKGRAAGNVTGIRAVFVDLDGTPLAPVLSAGLEPHAVVESSPGRWHCYWLVADAPLTASSRCSAPWRGASMATLPCTICRASCAYLASCIARARPS